jgi:hypothetical protein
MIDAKEMCIASVVFYEAVREKIPSNKGIITGKNPD